MIVFDSDHVAKNRGVLNVADHTAFIGNGLEPYEDFDYSAVDHNLGVPDPDEAALELASLLQWIWEDTGNLAAARERFRALAREALASALNLSRAHV